MTRFSTYYYFIIRIFISPKIKTGFYVPEQTTVQTEARQHNEIPAPLRRRDFLMLYAHLYFINK